MMNILEAVGETDTLQHSPAAESCAAVRDIIDVYYVLLSFFPRAAQGCSSYHLHHRHSGYFLLDVKQYPSHRTSSIQLNTFAHFLQRMCHFRGLLCCEGRAVAQWPSQCPTSLPSCPQLRPPALHSY